MPGIQPKPSKGRRDPKSRAIIFDPSPENQRIDRLKALVEDIIHDAYFSKPEMRGKLLMKLDKI